MTNFPLKFDIKKFCRKFIFFSYSVNLFNQCCKIVENLRGYFMNILHKIKSMIKFTNAHISGLIGQCTGSKYLDSQNIGNIFTFGFISGLSSC